MKSETKTILKRKKYLIANIENKNAFLNSVGTIGPKYVWTYDDQKILLTCINITGNREEVLINNI